MSGSLRVDAGPRLAWAPRPLLPALASHQRSRPARLFRSSKAVDAAERLGGAVYHATACTLDSQGTVEQAAIGVDTGMVLVHRIIYAYSLC